MPDRKLKVLIVARWPVGGIRTYMKYVYTKLQRDSYAFTLLAPNYAETQILLKDLENLTVHYVEMDENPSLTHVAKHIAAALKNNKVDVIHAHGLTAALCAILPSLFFGVPHVATIHDVFLDNQFVGIKGFIKKIILSLLMPLITKIHAVGNDVKMNIMQYLPIFKLFRNKIIAIRNGIDIERFRSSEKRDFRNELGLDNDTYLIGFLGRFMSQKGFNYLVDALALLNARDILPAKPVILTFGEGAFIREEQISLQSKGLQDKVYFLPFVSEVSSSIKGLDVVVMPSLWEACSLLPMETMVAGIPCIGTDCIGLKEVIEDTPCKMVPVRNSEALATAIAAEIKNPSTNVAADFKDEAIRRFDVTNHSQAIDQLFRLLAKRID